MLGLLRSSDPLFPPFTRIPAGLLEKELSSFGDMKCSSGTLNISTLSNCGVGAYILGCGSL